MGGERVVFDAEKREGERERETNRQKKQKTNQKLFFFFFFFLTIVDRRRNCRLRGCVLALKLLQADGPSCRRGREEGRGAHGEDLLDELRRRRGSSLRQLLQLQKGAAAALQRRLSGGLQGLGQARHHRGGGGHRALGEAHRGCCGFLLLSLSFFGFEVEKRLSSIGGKRSDSPLAPNQTAFPLLLSAPRPLFSVPESPFMASISWTAGFREERKRV